MNLLTFTTTINKIKITVELSYHALTGGEIMNKKKIYEIIKKELNFDYSFEENAQHILNALQPFCYKVEITPPTKGFAWYYTVSYKK